MNNKLMRLILKPRLLDSLDNRLCYLGMAFAVGAYFWGPEHWYFREQVWSLAAMLVVGFYFGRQWEREQS